MARRRLYPEQDRAGYHRRKGNRIVSRADLPSVRTVCPCCGRATTALIPMVDVNTTSAAFGPHFVRLTRRETQLLSALTQAYPRIVSTGELMHRIYGAAAYDAAQNAIMVWLSTLRRSLAPMGFGIFNYRGSGYRLERLAEPDEKPRTT